MTTVSILGAGVAGLTAAWELARRGARVAVVERRAEAGRGCSWWAGGMLAPVCEAATAEEPVLRLGREAAAWWEEAGATVHRRGTLVVAPSRDAGELRRFHRLAPSAEAVDAARIAELEPDLEGRFRSALFVAEEAHLDPRAALAALTARLRDHGAEFRFGADEAPPADVTLDARGLAARDALPDLRAVRGEMLYLRAPDVTLSRPVRLLHPRTPLYVVPRGDGRFMLGATMVESDRPGAVTARAVMELLSAAVALHPAFAEAELVETGADLRPAFPDNLPRLRRVSGRLHLNGLHRHGFLMAPALARMAADAALDPAQTPELLDAHRPERARERA